jgi:FkbM family methyltransferase
MRVKQWIRSALGRSLTKRGYALVRNSVSGTGWQSVLRTSLPAGSAETPLILDIGANIGGFSETALRFNPRAEIHAFEPIPKLADSIRTLSTRYPSLHCVQIALGSEPGECEFRVHQHIDSSSLLAPDATYNSLYPQHCVLSDLIKVPVMRLDDWAASSGVAPERPIDLVKMDVQGFEGQVVRGGAATLGRTRYLVTEAALFPAYQGGVMLDELCEQLRALGFQMTWAFNVFAASADLFWRNTRLLDGNLVK